MNKKNLLIIAVSVLVLALIGLTYLLFSEKQTNRELVQEFQLDKKTLKMNTLASHSNMTN